MKRIFLCSLMTIVTLGCAQEKTSDVASTETPKATAPAATTPPPTDGVVTVKVGSDFEPAVINAKAGVPLTLRFDRTGTDPTCGDEVVFASLNQTHKLPDKQITEVKITPAQSGDLQFTCGMNMMKGKIVVQ